ncbi:WYL domain-containing protein [Micrococcales bacterium 31B]|nr:WYL domain-containing protein [Micrococcales bacterium 31B]
MAINQKSRVLNLLIALDQAGRPLSASEIIERVPEYNDGEIPSSAPDFEAWDDKLKHAARTAFEEDKRALRGLGIDLELVGSAGSSRYRLARASAETAVTVSLDAAATALVQAAALQWKHAGRIAAEARRGATKALGYSDGIRALDTALLGQFMPDSEHFWGIFQAWSQRCVIEFDYRRSNSFVPQRRRVHPWLVVARERRWYLVGLDELRSEPRVFLLRRIMSEVAECPEVDYQPADPEYLAELASGSLWPAHVPGGCGWHERALADCEAVIALHGGEVTRGEA